MDVNKHESNTNNSNYKIYSTNKRNPERSIDFENNINQDSINNISTALYNSSVDIESRVDIYIYTHEGEPDDHDININLDNTEENVLSRKLEEEEILTAIKQLKIEISKNE